MNDDKAYKAAVRILTASDKTEAELTERLTGKGFTREEAESAVGRLVSLGFLNEKLHAERTVMRLFSAHYGRLYIEAYLENRGFGAEARERAGELLSMLDFDRAAAEYARALKKEGKTPDRILSALQRRGYEPGIE